MAVEKYSDDQPRDDHGRWGEGGAGSSRSQRAMATHKPVTMHARNLAARAQADVAKYTNGHDTDSGGRVNLPLDVLVKVGRTMHGIEVKAFVNNSNDKVTMHPASRLRKEKWAKQNGAKLHTVVLDERSKYGSPNYSGNRIYYRVGVGSFRLAGMTPVRDAAHLRQLMGLKKKSALSELTDVLRMA